MDVLLCLERCVGCERLFLICRPCYFGQTYCEDACREPARKAQARAARSTYQRSARGRRVRSDRRRELRRRAASIRLVMDQGTENVAPASSVCLPQGPLAPMSGVLEVDGRSRNDDSPQCGPKDEATFKNDRGEAPRRRGGGDDEDSPFSAATPSAAELARGPRVFSVATHQGQCCDVCHQPGIVVSSWPSRRALPARRRGPRHDRAAPS